MGNTKNKKKASTNLPNLPNQYPPSHTLLETGMAMRRGELWERRSAGEAPPERGRVAKRSFDILCSGALREERAVVVEILRALL
jgi:hypothetical protein